MRIGLSGSGSTVDRIVEQAVEAEADGFSAVWYPSVIAGDPMVAMAIAGRATSSIELGTAVLQTYTCHPTLMARRAASVASAMGRPGFTLGLGPSHAPMVEGLGLSYDHPGRHTEEYVRIVVAALRGEDPTFDGEEFQVRGAASGIVQDPPVSVLVGALAARSLRVAGSIADGTILWMANDRAIESHVVPRIVTAAAAAGRPAPRVVAGLPVAVHDDVAEAREAAAQQFAVYATLPNYRRILDAGGLAGPAEAAIVGNEEAVAGQLSRLIDAGATDIWAAAFPVGADRRGSRDRTRALLQELAVAG